MAPALTSIVSEYLAPGGTAWISSLDWVVFKSRTSSGQSAGLNVTESQKWVEKHLETFGEHRLIKLVSTLTVQNQGETKGRLS